MTVITMRTKSFETRMRDTAATVLLLSDEDGDVAETVHDIAQTVLKAGQFVFLLRGLGFLTDQERALWFTEGGHYAVVGGTNRVVAVRGPLADFLLSDGSVSRVEIRHALARGDQLP